MFFHTPTLAVALVAALSMSAGWTRDKCSHPPMADSESLVQYALTCNAGQRAQHARVEAQRQRAAASGHLDDPRLSIGAAPRTFDNDQLPDGTVVELSQSLPWPGVLQLRREMAMAGTDSQLHAAGQEAVELALAVRLAHADRYYHAQLLRINRRHRKLWQTFADGNRARYASGRGDKTAALQAQQEERQLQVEEIFLQQALARDNSRLARLVNLPPRALPASVPLPQRSPPTDALALAQAHLDTQPEMRRLRAERERSTKAQALAEKDRHPEFSLLARHNNIWANPDQRLLFAVGINLPLDIGGKRSAHERSLAADQLALDWQREDTAQALLDTLRRATSRWRESRDLLQLYETQLLPLSEESLATARDAFASGSGDFLSLLVAERNLLDVEKKARAAGRDRFVALAQLTAAAGLVMLDDWRALGADEK